MRSDLVSKSWKTTYKLIRRAPWLAALILAALSYLFVRCINGQPEYWSIGGLSKDIVLKVVGSLLASAVFLLFMNLLLALKDARAGTEQEYFERMHGGFGIKDAYDQRGTTDVSTLYDKLLEKASSRIWAMGVTNRKFVNFHENRLRGALERSASMEMRVFFADPSIGVCWGRPNGEGKRPSTNGIDLQMDLERQTPLGTDWESYLNESTKILRKLPTTGDVGTLRVMLFRSICFSSLFVIDDDVFLFPMLARGESSHDPIIHVGADSVLGRCVIEHMERVFHNPKYCECVYSNKNDEPGTAEPPGASTRV